MFEEKEVSMGREAKVAFVILKKMLCTALVLALLDFDKLFEVDYDASDVRIWAILF